MRVRKPIVFDLDDYCDAVVGKLDYLYRLKEKMPALRCTLFAIPAKCSAATIAEAKKHEWISLGMHGWRHTLGECWSWTKEEAVEKMKAAEDMGIDARVFRAPMWIIDAEVYYAAEELGWAIADHKDFRILGSGVRTYTYNKPTWNPAWTRVHGHLPNVCDNGIEEAFERFVFPADAEFRDVAEVAAVDTGVMKL